MKISNGESFDHLLLKRLALLKLYRMNCLHVAEEVFCGCEFGNIDAVGIRQQNMYFVNSTVNTVIGIEVKVSRSDYFGKKQKGCARRLEWMFDNEKEVYLNQAYFLTPEGLIKPSELYKGWGLLEWDGFKIKKIVDAPKMNGNIGYVAISMVSAMQNEYHRRITGIMDSESYVKLTYSEMKEKLLNGKSSKTI